MKKARFIFLFLLFLSCLHVSANEWQWSVKLRNYITPETNDHPDAFLWIPSRCNQVRAVVVGQHNMSEETIFEHPAFREAMSELGFAIIWISPGFEQQWDVSNGCQEHFNTMLDDLAEVSGYSELKFAPVIPLGHSAMATYPWNFAAWNPERTLAVISYHGDAPRTNLTGYGRENLEWGRTRNIDGIPGLMIMGEHEWWEARVNPALAFRMMYPESCISFLCDAGYGHFDVSDEVVDYISLFLKKASQYRLPKNQELDKSVTLHKVDMKNGWMAERWHTFKTGRPGTAPVSDYSGDKHDAFWYFDEEMAEATEKYYQRTWDKEEQYIGFAHNGSLIPLNNGQSSYTMNIDRLANKDDGLTFSLSAVFTDSLHSEAINCHSEKNKIKISRICGPVKQLNDTTFSIRFYRMGVNNPKRTGSIWLMAHYKGDEMHKSAVQQININLPYPNIKGKEQKITFPEINDVNRKTNSISLKAFSDAHLPVYYYIKEGPAIIDEKRKKVIITEIPPRAKYPLKVTVVAWQYGEIGEEGIRTADAIERSFYITN